VIPLKTIWRVFELIGIIVKNVFGFVVDRLKLFMKKSQMDHQTYEDELWKLVGRRIRMTLEEMGATFIKLAQILSTRRDLYPPPTLEELEKLQDEVPPFDGTLVPPIFERDFGKKIEDVFDSFDLTPVASASVAQVHHGVLKDGREAAMKVIRPGIEDKMIEDLKIMKFIVRVLTKIPFLELRSLIGFTDYFAEMIHKQLDLTIEAENNRRYKECFKNEGDKVRFPTLIEEYCSKDIMTMEFVHGVKPTQLNPEVHNVRKVAEAGLYLYYAMVCHGLIHADLHPGNMLISDDNFFWVFDLGLVDELAWDVRKSFFEAWFSTFNHDGGPFARLLLKFSISHQITDFDAFEADVSAWCEKHLAERIQDIEFGGTMMGMGDLQRKYKIVADPTWTSIAVSLVSVEGMARFLNPDMRIVRTISPHLKKFLRRIYLMDPRLKDKRSSKTGERLIQAQAEQ